MTISDINALTRQKDLLLEKLSAFEETNRMLWHLLKEQYTWENLEQLMAQPSTEADNNMEPLKAKGDRSKQTLRKSSHPQKAEPHKEKECPDQSDVQLVEEVLKSCMEAGEATVKQEQKEYGKEKKTLIEEMAKEIEDVREQIENQVAELERLPEIVRLTEIKLAKCRDQLKSYEKKNVDLSAMITDLRQRLEQTRN